MGPKRKNIKYGRDNLIQPVILELFACRCILALTQARHHIHSWHKCILTLSKRNTFNSEPDVKDSV